MNRDRLQGNWKQLSGIFMEQWGRLTDDPLRVVAGKRDQRFGRLQEQYGTSVEEAEHQLRDFLARNRNWDTVNR